MLGVSSSIPRMYENLLLSGAALLEVVMLIFPVAMNPC
jgi:hypothetical protein